ncbi:MAG: hypothetical protein QXO69_02580 [archaeon]
MNDETSEENRFYAELSLISELKSIVSSSNLERKTVLLTALEDQEQKIRNGFEATRLPEIVRNLAKKPEVKDRVITATKKYRISGESLHYLWGLE